MTKRRTKRARGPGLFGIVAWCGHLRAAVRHLRTGGKSTEQAARAKAAAPAGACPHCGHPMKHSSDWRDHYDLYPEHGLR